MTNKVKASAVWENEGLLKFERREVGKNNIVIQVSQKVVKHKELV